MNKLMNLCKRCVFNCDPGSSPSVREQNGNSVSEGEWK